MEDSGGGGGDNGGGPGLMGACIFCCIGLILFPASLVFTGWNEQRTVCREKAILSAEDHNIDLMCDSVSNAVEGDLGYLDCPLDTTTFKNFTEADFTGLQGMTDLFSPSLSAVGVTMKVEQMTCKEKCVREECRRRLSSSDEGEEDADGLTEEDSQHRRSLLAPRDRSRVVAPRRLKKSSSCTTTCVEYGYWLEWSSEEGSHQFQDPNAAQRACSAYSNPTSAVLQVGEQHFHTAAGQVTVVGGAWRLNSWQLQVMPIDEEVKLRADFMANGQSFIPSTDPQPPASLHEKNTLISDNMIHSCQSEKIGCLRVSFKRSHPEHVVALGKVSNVAGTFDESGWEAPPDWLCSGYDINRICPMDSTQDSSYDLTKGVQVCEESPSKDEFFEKMYSENSTSAWIYRVVGWLLCWIAVCMIFCPVTTIVEMASDMLDSLTECIPGIGCLVDQMTDMFVGLVQSVVCCVSFMCATSCFLTVMAIAWVVMRPLYGIAFLSLATCFCCCAAGIMSMFKGQGSSKRTVSMVDPESGEE